MDERETAEAAGEPARRDTAATTRSQSVAHFIERNADEAARLLSSLLERSGEAGSNPRVLVIVPTPDDALAISEAVVALRRPEGLALIPITSVARGRRLLATNPAAIAASPNELSALIAQSLIPMAGLQSMVLVWPEELLFDERLSQLEAVVAEIPRSTERLAIAASRSPELSLFMERVMFKARTMDHTSSGSSGISLRLVTAAPGDRLSALRSVLDALDPERAVLVAFSAATEAAAREAVAVLGGPSANGMLQVSRGVPVEHFNLAMVFDDVPNAGALGRIAAIVDEVVAIVRPARVGGLRRIAGDVRPFVWSGAAAAARSAQDAIREEIRGHVGSGGHLPWVHVIEPLVGELDPVEVAASAVALLERERRRAKRVAAVVAAQPPAVAAEPARESRSSGPGARPPGRRDEGRPERSFTKKRPGEFDRPRRDDGPRGRPSFRDRGERPGAPRDRGERSGPRPGGRDDARPGRRGPDAGGRDRPPRRDDIERMPRAARESTEWSERGDRLRNARRGPRGGDGR